MTDGHEREKSDSKTLPRVALMRGILNLRIIYQSKLGRGIVVSTLVLAFGVPIVAATLNYNGYCFAENRFLSNTEFIDFALRVALMPGGIRLAKNYQANPSPSLSDARSFRDAHPDCCTFEKHNSGDLGPYVSFSQRVFGRAAKIVRVSIPSTSDPSAAGSITQYAVENCGRAWNSTH